MIPFLAKLALLMALVVCVYAVGVLLVAVAHDRIRRKRDARELRESAARWTGMR
jgi:hypothetical protein